MPATTASDDTALLNALDIYINEGGGFTTSSKAFTRGRAGIYVWLGNARGDGATFREALADAFTQRATMRLDPPDEFQHLSDISATMKKNFSG